MQRYDLVVIGAGPAGSSSAEAAAQAGVRTLLLEKQRLPRHKTCGGGMPHAVGISLPGVEQAGVVEADVRYMRHTWQFGEAVMGEVNPPGSEPELRLWMVQRSVFDFALTQRAAAAGAELRDAAPVRALEADRSGVTVRAGRDGAEMVVRADYVVGADGANGIAARSVGLRRGRKLAIAMEAEVPHRWGAGHPDLRPEVLHLDFGVVRDGYAWVFPKGDHLNVGAGVFRPHADAGKSETGHVLRSVILGYLEALGVPFDADRLDFHAHPLPVWSGHERLADRGSRVLLAGDAAGLVNPLFGDGILHAIRSGIVAARCVAADDTRQYSRLVAEQVTHGFGSAARLAGFMYQFPRISFRHAVARPSGTRTAALLLSGQLSFQDAARSSMGRLRRALLRGGADEGLPSAP